MTDIELYRNTSPYLPARNAGIKAYAEVWRRADGLTSWIQGDLLVQLRAVKKDKGIKELASLVGETTSRMYALLETAEAFPPDSRRLEISWSVHQSLKSQDDRAALIASRDRWTVTEARKVVKQRQEQAPAPTLPAPAQPVLQVPAADEQGDQGEPEVPTAETPAATPAEAPQTPAQPEPDAEQAEQDEHEPAAVEQADRDEQAEHEPDRDGQDWLVREPDFALYAVNDSNGEIKDIEEDLPEGWIAEHASAIASALEYYWDLLPEDYRKEHPWKELGEQVGGVQHPEEFFRRAVRTVAVVIPDERKLDDLLFVPVDHPVCHLDTPFGADDFL